MTTHLRDSYANGRHRGFAQGEVDLSDGLGVMSDRIADLREQLHWCGPAQRAHTLGFLRGYRESVRSLRNGRWVT